MWKRLRLPHWQSERKATALFQASLPAERMLDERRPLLLAYDITEGEKRPLQHGGISEGWLELSISCQNGNVVAVFAG